MDPILIVLLKLIWTKFESEKGRGQALTEIKVVGLGPCGPPSLATYAHYRIGVFTRPH